jgi:hypothetical protein
LSDFLKIFKFYLFTIACLLIFQQQAFSQKKKVAPPKPIFVDQNGKLSYTPDAQGNRIPDFSFAGYQSADKEIPEVAAIIKVPIKIGDATPTIQKAIDYVSNLPINKDGFRGAIILEKGTYDIHGQLIISKSGVVLRGCGMGPNGTILKGSGTDRQTLIRITGGHDIKSFPKIEILNNYVPVNAMSFNIAKADHFKVGDQVFITRPSTKEWLDTTKTWTFGGGLSSLGWKPGEENLVWDRKITAIKGSEITIDAPITTALDQKFGGGTLAKYEWNGRADHIGIENLSLESTFNPLNPKDEQHRWMAITIENAANIWVRQITFKHFAGSAVNVLSTAKCVTVEDCKSLAPISEIGGQRRYTFQTNGQQTLFQRLYSEYGYHDFAVGYLAAGPNAFVQCQAYLPFSYSGAIDTWASGTLFDIMNIDGNALNFSNIGQDARGAGWTAANSVFWQCTASRVNNFSPPTAQNWAFGTWSEFAGDGYWDSSNEHVNPRSLYYAQLQDRLGKDISSRIQLLPFDGEATSSPTVLQAKQMTLAASLPLPQLIDYIDSASIRNPIQTHSENLKSIDQITQKTAISINKPSTMQLKNGWLVRDEMVLIGGRLSEPWWSGGVQGTDLNKAQAALTRFVPGRVGKGLTDDLNQLTDTMLAKSKLVVEHNYGLWYDRRRDDHERIRRMDGDVWPPFYELPYARSGNGKAYDGLSKYDLTKFNPWYWNRLKEYADLADKKGLVLIHQNYFQHNIIEAGAHYVDFPWRTANNINATGFAEPAPFAGDKRIFLADQFYDVMDKDRVALHQIYINQCLNNFKGNSSVIQFIGQEFTGPLHFMQFWVDVIKNWEKENNTNASFIGLSATKDVQDSILNDPDRSSTIDVIDIRYWYYQADETPYAPLGGQSLAPRQQARQFKPKKTSFEQVYRAVKEYRLKYPDKAIVYSADNYDAFAWAAFMAGASLTEIPVLNAQFCKSAATMLPISKSQQKYILTNQHHEYIIYTNTDVHLDDLDVDKSTFAEWINPISGEIIVKYKIDQNVKIIHIPTNQSAVLWIHKK